jgi:hypothetical protein
LNRRSDEVDTQHRQGEIQRVAINKSVSYKLPQPPLTDVFRGENGELQNLFSHRRGKSNRQQQGNINCGACDDDLAYRAPKWWQAHVK